MNKKIVIMILLGLAINISSFAQLNKNDNEINRFNEKGQKEGFWKEDLGYQFEETYYHNGLKNGFYKAYGNGNLYYIGEYKDGIITGTWYYFDDLGRLGMIQKDFQKNDKPTPLVHRVDGILPNRCYTILYYPNGNKRSEGIILWEESPEGDLTFEYGEWKYYDDKGNLIKTKEFK